MAANKKEGLRELLARADALLEEVSPEARKALHAGAKLRSLAKLDKLANKVPADVKTLFAWHDGQEIEMLHPKDNRTLMSIEEAWGAWKFLSDPKEDVQQPWSKSWLPVFANGAGDYVCVEMAGKNAGSLVEYWHDDDDRDVVHASLAAWASDLIRALEKEAAKQRKAPAKREVTLDASSSRWSVMNRPLTKEQLAKRAVGTVFWRKRAGSMFKSAPFALWVKVAAVKKAPWRHEGSAKSVDDALAKIQTNLARKRALAEGYEFFAEDWSLAYEIESSFDTKAGRMREGTVSVKA
jgi:cell wall assembly regulator SMI1